MNGASIHRRAAALVAGMMISAAMVQAAETVKVRAVFVGDEREERSAVLYLKEGDPSRPLAVGDGRLSEEFQLPRMERWSFGYWQNVAGRTSFVEQCGVEPAKGSQIWLIFHPEPEVAIEKDGASERTESTGLGVSALAVEKLGEGDVAVVNLTDGEVEAELDGKASQVGPGGSVFVRPTTAFGERYAVKFHLMQGERKRLFVTTNWFRGEKRRRLAVVIGDGRRPVPKLLAIDEVGEGNGDSD